MNSVSKPLAKFEQRVLMWAGMRLGLSINLLAFNMYIPSVLEYVAQLLLVDDWATTAMTWAMRKLAPGPGSWIELCDLENLATYGFPAFLVQLVQQRKPRSSGLA